MRVNYLINQKHKDITNQLILETNRTDQNCNNIKKWDEVMMNEIIHPFINFLHQMINYGANPHMQVQKLKEFWDEVNDGIIKHYSQNG